MSIKRGHLLRSDEGIPDDVMERLRSLSITTAEEFVSQLASDPDAMAAYLAVPPDQLDALMKAVDRQAGSEFVADAKKYVPSERSLGARQPGSDEFERIRAERRSDSR